jgi:hypothetical protein
MLWAQCASYNFVLCSNNSSSLATAENEDFAFKTVEFIPNRGSMRKTPPEHRFEAISNAEPSETCCGVK